MLTLLRVHVFDSMERFIPYAAAVCKLTSYVIQPTYTGGEGEFQGGTAAIETAAALTADQVDAIVIGDLGGRGLAIARALPEPLRPVTIVTYNTWNIALQNTYIKLGFTGHAILTSRHVEDDSPTLATSLQDIAQYSTHLPLIPGAVTLSVV